MKEKVNFLEFDDKVRNLSIPLDDVFEILSSMSRKEAQLFFGAYIIYQATGDDNAYKGRHQALWRVMISKKNKYFLRKHLKKTTTVEDDIITRTQAELLAKSKEKVEEQGILTGSTNLNDAPKEVQELFNQTLKETLNEK